ncbi:type II toxin-antitoxin system PemK/MazF family toxin [Pilimelia columellifera]|uniref:Type II toxin-antitoxin system toxin endoribonuclease PemK n=1 Tax=Pilimelia columellifera subsp. columellifera TaxID=706583 RepID=A0ABP6AWM3_9ACTN
MRGEVYELSRPKDVLGHEQRGERYAVVVQASELAALSTWIVCPTSTRAQPASFRPVIDFGAGETLVMVDEMTVISPPSRLGRQVGYLPAGGPEMRAIDAAIAVVLNLD